MSGITKRPLQERVFKAGEIGEIARERRKELGYTQAQIAEMTGWSPRLVGDIERGKATVGVQRVLDYLTGLGIDVTLSSRGAQ